MEAPGRREVPARWLSAQWEEFLKAWVCTGQVATDNWVVLFKREEAFDSQET